MVVSKVSSKPSSAKARTLRRKRISHSQTCRRIQQSVQNKLDLTVQKLKGMQIQSRLKATLKTKIRQIRHITSAPNIQTMRSDKELRFRSSVACGTAAFISIFTGGFVTGVASAAASTVVSTMVSKSYEKRSPIQEAIENAKNRNSDWYYSNSMPRKKTC